jgi:hypothetical protein
VGLHEIAEKIGDGVEWGTISRNAKRWGYGSRGDPDGKALITSRILWLRGLEEGKNLGYECGSYNRKSTSTEPTVRSLLANPPAQDVWS